MSEGPLCHPARSSSIRPSRPSSRSWPFSPSRRQAGRPPPGIEIEVTGTLVEVSAALTAARARKELMKALLVERARVELARASAAPSIAGPIVVALLFAVAAGAMLPGAETFAASHFQLNTALLLFLGYGWMFLLLWAVLGLSLLTTRSTFDARNLVPAAK